MSATSSAAPQRPASLSAVPTRDYDPKSPPRAGEWVYVSGWVEEEDRPTLDGLTGTKRTFAKSWKLGLAVLVIALISVIALAARRSSTPAPTVNKTSTKKKLVAPPSKEKSVEKAAPTPAKTAAISTVSSSPTVIRQVKPAPAKPNPSISNRTVPTIPPL